MSRWCREVSRSVEAVSRWCQLTLVSMVSTRVDPCRPASEGGLTVYTRVTCHSVDSVECRSVERVGVCQACQACRVCVWVSPKYSCQHPVYTYDSNNNPFTSVQRFLEYYLCRALVVEPSAKRQQLLVQRHHPSLRRVGEFQ